MTTQHRQLIISISILIVAGIGLYLLLRYVPARTVPAENVSQAVIDTSLVTIKTYATPTDYATYEVSYPQFANASAEFNKKIEDVAMNAVHEHAKDSEENWKARYETRTPGETIAQKPSENDKFQLAIKYEPAQVNSLAISFILRISGYTGGAHGYENLVSFNYDVQNAKELTLDDFFKATPNYLTILSDFSRKELTAQFHERLEIKTPEDEQNFTESTLPMLLDGTKPEAQNFSVFTFTPKEMTVYFTQYQVAPYVMGESQVVFPIQN